MTIAKWPFFFMLAALVSFPFLVYKAVWIAGSAKTTGRMAFVGKSQTGQLQHTYAVIYFKADGIDYWFNGNDNILFKENEPVEVRYQVNNPYDARINVWAAMWGDTLVYGGIPFLIILAVFLHPHIFPRNTIFQLRKNTPFIQVNAPPGPPTDGLP